MNENAQGWCCNERTNIDCILIYSYPFFCLFFFELLGAHYERVSENKQRLGCNGQTFTARLSLPFLFLPSFRANTRTRMKKKLHDDRSKVVDCVSSEAERADEGNAAPQRFFPLAFYFEALGGCTWYSLSVVSFWIRAV